jgi:hypothetical protein
VAEIGEWLACTPEFLVAMGKTIRVDEIARIVAEVDRLSEQQRLELSSEEVKQILVDLNLSADLLDQALIQLQRRDALLQRRQQRRRRFWQQVTGLVVVAAISGALVSYHIIDQQATLSRVRAQSSRITSEPDTGAIKVASRQFAKELVFRVTLAEAPVGRRVPLTCDWLAPTGEIVKQNRYETRVVTTPIWPSYCRLQLNSSLPPGSWRVRMRQGERLISEQRFDMR